MTFRKKRTLGALCIAAATIALICFTRFLSVSHNMHAHPDEHVFYLTVNSLLNSILHPGLPFEEFKEYPEGTYYFQLIFHFIGKVLSVLTGGDHNIQLWGRIASIFYFTAATLLGMRILLRYLGKGLVSLGLYGFTMCFSLFFIEQSRYGTGDMISLMLLMLLLNLTAQALESGKNRWWLGAFFVCGILGAVKYPQLVFSLIPLTAFLSQCRPWKKSALFLPAVLAGFFLFSPKTMVDPAYLLRVMARESDAYATSTHEAGGAGNHLVSLLLYMLLYSDFPLLPPVILAGMAIWLFRFFRSRGRGTGPQGTALLFQILVPGAVLLFFLYNLFVPALFFRTMTPLFGLLCLYTAVAGEALFSRSRWSRMAVIALAAVLVLRGAGLVWVLSDDSKAKEKLSDMVSSAVDENWREICYTSLFCFAVSSDQAEEIQHYYLHPLVEENGGLEIQPGQLIVTGALNYHTGQRYLLPVPTEIQAPISLWAEFKEANQNYLLGQVYPNWYYSLFGGWIRGSTLSQYEFPCHYIYYRSE